MNKFKLYIGNILFIAASTFLFSGCGFYSFTGASIDYSKVRTISIGTFYDESNAGPANLSQDFTNAIRDYFQQNTSLALVDEEGDLQIEGIITGYRFSPQAPQSGGNQNIDGADAAGVERLTITVKADYINNSDDTFDFENKSFSFFDDYDPNSQDRSSQSKT
ncbi:LptE family protein [Persicobacter sp. CCB-QB2]|uniref:LptE family protein n=1 Tax=Persicobacter sp. CCB-QB2 TaxID=1561025 RepID=UPI0006A9DA73|nr:LptE family protein [Persicobacter sp. CCB-QB2]